MRCLVTGGSGYIGSHLVQKLLEADHEVAVLDFRKPPMDVDWIEHDVREDLGDALKGFEAVYHLAAVANARRTSEMPEMAYSTNVLGTVNVMQAAKRVEVGRVLLASTEWVAGAQASVEVDETVPFNLPDVNTNYGTTKLAQEMICYAFKGDFGHSDFAPDFTILRYGIPYGERMWKGLVVRAFMDQAERGGQVNIMGDGKQYRGFLYVGDLCEAQVLALDPIAANKVYYLTADRPVTVEELAREVIKHFPAEIQYITQIRVEPKIKRIRNDLVKKELGWEPTTPLVAGIAKCVEWWRGLTDEQKAEGYWI